MSTKKESTRASSSSNQREATRESVSVDDLEEEGYGRRSNCPRCKLKVPRQADLACGNWGVIGDKAGKATFVEVCSPKGADLLE